MNATRVLLIALAGVAVYARTFGVPFVFDDGHAIVQNLRIREWSSELFASDRPLVEITLALNYALGGLQVAGYHAFNLALHVACGWLLFDVARRTFRMTETLAGREDDAACLAALLFVVHPLQTEAVTYAISRSELLMALCYLATLDLVLVAEAHPARRSVLWVLAIAVCAFGMLAKPIMVTAPLVVWWLSWWVLAPPTRPRLTFAATPPAVEVPRRWPLHLGLCATWLVLVVLFADHAHPGAGFDIGIEPLAYLRTQLGVTWRYFRLLVWPVGQVLDYDWPLAARWLEPAVLVSAFGWVLLVLALVALARRGRRAATFWLGFALLALLPSSSVIPIADLAFEHRMYLSVGGFAALAALAAGGAAARAPRVVAAAAVVVVALLGALAIARNEVWRDPVTLWTDTLAKAPTKQRVYRNLEEAYQRRGDHGGMRRVVLAEIETLERLHRAAPRDARVLTGLANGLARVGRTGEALAAVLEAIRLDPRDPVARAAHGALLMQLARPEEAVAPLEMAAAMIEGHVGWIERDTKRVVQVNLGWAYAAIGRTDDALRVLREAAAEDDVSAMNNLGSVLGRVGEWEEAERVLEQARRRDPDDPNVQSNLGWVYANLGRLDEAAALLERAILQQPGEPSAHGNLGWVRLRAGDAAGAKRALEMALTLQPDNPWVVNMMGIASARLGDWTLAVASFERALQLVPDSRLARENLVRALAREEPASMAESP
ncbi:MAG: tetratricopeptide repeat protein [Deltaproteobacteria bacterium]|nr:tetratricopeptide repeat protein [Deltaproteobacteria bacterium]